MQAAICQAGALDKLPPLLQGGLASSGLIIEVLTHPLLTNSEAEKSSKQGSVCVLTVRHTIDLAMARHPKRNGCKHRFCRVLRDAWHHLQ